MILPVRKPTRLKNYDYGSAGAYFITVCTRDRQCLLSDIIVGEGLAPPELKLTPYGKIAEQQIQSLETRFPSVSVNKHVIMPNHIHFILWIPKNAGGASPSPTVIDLMRTFKSITTRMCETGAGLFQRSFHDHVIRDEADYWRIWEYIDKNPLHWAEDCFYMMPREIVGEGLGPPARQQTIAESRGRGNVSPVGPVVR